MTIILVAIPTVLGILGVSWYFWLESRSQNDDCDPPY